MTMSTFLLEIITPQRIVFSEQVQQVSVPSSSGQIGVLAHHVPLFSELVEGEVKVVRERDEIFLAIGGGYIEVTPQKVSILVSVAYKADEINEKEIMEARKRAEEALKQKPQGQALIEAQQMLVRSSIALKLLEKRRSRHIRG